MRTLLTRRSGPSCTAVLCIRDGRHYLPNLVNYLLNESISIQLIVHDELDYSDLLSSFNTDRIKVRRMRATDGFSLRDQLKERHKAAVESNSEWILNLDVDEVPHSFREGEGLLSAIRRISDGRFNVIDFHEFVFLPIESNYDVNCGAIQKMKYYYFHQPRPNRLNRVFRRNLGFPTTETGGHTAEGADIRVASEQMALRHYMFRDSEHAKVKYGRRQFDDQEVRDGWHVNRIGVPEARFTFPDATLLESLADPRSRALRIESPRLTHYWEWE